MTKKGLKLAIMLAIVVLSSVLGAWIVTTQQKNNFQSVSKAKKDKRKM
jgi:UPF0716 family protein affecting phage T7 exclusion